MERILLAQETLKKAIEKEAEARVAFEEAIDIRKTIEKHLEDVKRQYIEDNKVSAVNRKTACKIWFDSEGNQHEIEYFVV